MLKIATYMTPIIMLPLKRMIMIMMIDDDENDDD